MPTSSTGSVRRDTALASPAASAEMAKAYPRYMFTGSRNHVPPRFIQRSLRSTKASLRSEGGTSLFSSAQIEASRPCGMRSRYQRSRPRGVRLPQGRPADRMPPRAALLVGFCLVAVGIPVPLPRSRVPGPGRENVHLFSRRVSAGRGGCGKLWSRRFVDRGRQGGVYNVGV